MSRIEIEVAQTTDRAFLFEMILLSIKSLPHVAIRPTLEIEAMARMQLMSWEIGRNLAFIARQNKQSVGAAWLQPHGEHSALHYSLGLAVAPPFQHHGIGTKLMAYLLDYCKRNNGSTIGLQVHPSNLPAMRLYRRFEFEEVTLEMRKKL